MCRWLAYSGSPVLVEDLLYKPEHSLIVQSMHSTMGAEATNGDGVGVGWSACESPWSTSPSRTSSPCNSPGGAVPSPTTDDSKAVAADWNGTDGSEVLMCRWLAYSGSPVLVEDLLYKPEHSLIVQSMHSTMGAEATNGDGVGVGWYGDRATPGLFRSIEPAWNDRNLRDLAAHISSPRVFAHIRAAIGSPVQQTNCHPFRHGRWLWMHNGFIDGFHAMKRDLAMAVDPDRFADLEGTTDSEILFFLALTFGLEADAPAAVARAVGLVEETASRHGVAFPMQGTLATTDGETTWAFRYSSEGRSRSLFHSTDVSMLKQQYPENPALHELSDEARLVVSEPLGELRGAWREVPEASSVAIRGGEETVRPFKPSVSSGVG